MYDMRNNVNRSEVGWDEGCCEEPGTAWGCEFGIASEKCMPCEREKALKAQGVGGGRKKKRDFGERNVRMNFHSSQIQTLTCFMFGLGFGGSEGLFFFSSFYSPSSFEGVWGLYICVFGG